MKMNKMISFAVLSVLFFANAVFAQMSAGKMEGDHGNMMGTEKPHSMMSGQMINHNMMTNMSEMMGRMDEMMKSMEVKMKDHAKMDKTKMLQMSQVMKDMAKHMEAMSLHMENGDMSEAMNKMMHEKLDSMDSAMKNIK